MPWRSLISLDVALKKRFKLDFWNFIPGPIRKLQKERILFQSFTTLEWLFIFIIIIFNLLKFKVILQKVNHFEKSIFVLFSSNMQIKSCINCNKISSARQSKNRSYITLCVCEHLIAVDLCFNWYRWCKRKTMIAFMRIFFFDCAFPSSITAQVGNKDR